jgi:hypothetical protein
LFVAYGSFDDAAARAVAIKASHNVPSFIDASAGLRGSDGHLVSDWKSQVDARAPEINSFIANGTSNGIFLGDEIYCGGKHGLSLDDLHQFSDAVKAASPNAFIWSNECGSSLESKDFSLPASLDAFSVDKYHTDGKVKDWVQEGVREKIYQQKIYPKLHSHQGVFLIPGSFSSKVNKNCNEDCYNEMLAYDIGQFADWAKEDSKVLGVVPWTWGSCSECTKDKDEIGTENLPKLQSALADSFSKF